MASLTEILHRVQKPGRYIGEETNVVKKEWSPQKISVALAYPDTYEIGMSYLGLKILYHLLNEQDDILCERVFAPWPDMEGELRAAGMPLYGLESKRPLRDFDIVGFSLSYELTYSNVLNMLDLGGISVLSEKRREDEPLVIAGGACCFNPEPMSAFVDVFFIGDAEETLPEFIRRYRELKGSGAGKRDALKELSGRGGVYVPGLYEPLYAAEKFSGLKKLDDSAPERIFKASVADLDKAYYPVKQIVPLVRVVHDRIAVEVMRGCPNRCRFCQASAVNRPVRIRSVGKIRDLCRRSYLNTGYESVALLSLSSVNYPHLSELVKGLGEDLGSQGVGVSIPSLRVDEAFYDIPEMLSAIKKAGLTFAPESANAGTRRAIGKDIDVEVLCKAALAAYENGWKGLKLYFMVGFPLDDIEEAANILSLARRLSSLRREKAKGPAEIKLSVNPFVPKPQTAFQWLGMKDPGSLETIRAELMRGASKRVKVDFHDIKRAVLEAALSRGDRRTGRAVYGAWKSGAKMDSWSDYFNPETWEDSFRAVGMDMREEAEKRFSMDDELPWGHVGVSTDTSGLKREFQLSGLADAL